MQESITLIILGIVQGLTEFLPVSSTGHLILAREILGFKSGSGLAEDAILHLATAFAVLVYFRSDIRGLWVGMLRAVKARLWNKEMTIISALVIGTIPAVTVGLVLEGAIETVFRSAFVVAGALIVGSIIMLVAEYLEKKVIIKKEITFWRGMGIGFFQTLALIPGMSRSGMTISGGMLFGLSRVEAARFAFLLSFPIILGAGGMKLFELVSSGEGAAGLTALSLGGLAAFLSGLAAIHALITLLKTRTLMPFIVYRLLLAGIILLTFYIK